METTREITGVATLSMRVAPEDLQRGDMVAALNIVQQYPSFLWGELEGLAPSEPVHVQYRAPFAGMPLKIQAISLPFVFVKLPSGKSQTMDIRQTQLVRLDSQYAETVWKALK